jgi:hypothetical protein
MELTGVVTKGGVPAFLMDKENLCHLSRDGLPVFPQLPDRCHDQMLHERAAE